MKFHEYPYVRPNFETVNTSFNTSLDQFKNATSFEEQDKIISKINALRNEVESMMVLVIIRNSIDTTDEFYCGEQIFLDENMPLYQGLVTEYYHALLTSPFKIALEEKWGKQIFTIADLALKTFRPEVISLMQMENKLVSEYTKLKASAKISFEGKDRNLSQMKPFTESRDRDIRFKAELAITEFYVSNEEQFDCIYDKMVKTRHEIALKLGYENYVSLGYARLGRSDYNANMVSNYRKQVYENIVPVTEALKKRQAKRLGLETLKYYDESLQFLTGNATPKGSSEWMLDNAKNMYRQLSNETHEFFSYMTDNELLDLVTKKGKAGGGYCTYISKYKSPFIFSNFNGTSGDVGVLTHEAGHAFQFYTSRNYELPEYVRPTLEACEIYSMSMEFFAWPWMENFFKEDHVKYKFSHLSGALLLIPYGVAVDEFQHFVYENPNITPTERKSKWAEIEKKYMPSKDYEDNFFLNRGGFWFRQSHIFANPFYFIDYTLAQVCAFEFWQKSCVAPESAWDDYLRLCQAGGSKSFLELLKIAKLNNPFEDGTIKKIIEPIRVFLDTVEDQIL